MMEDMAEMTSGMVLTMGLAMAFVVALVTVAVVATVRLLRRRSPSPLERLDRRYARGELTAAEYQRRRADITGAGWPAPDWPA